MFPKLYINNWVDIYLFGVCITIAWALFFGLLHWFSVRKGLSKRHIFIENIVLFTLSMFLFSRIFYILIEWRSEKFLFMDLFSTGNIFGFLKSFFITDNYSLSFAGGVIGFLVVFFSLTHGRPQERARYWDVIVPAFFIAGIVGYLGALLGGQIYGKVVDFPLTITYNHQDSIVPLQNPTFPLPVVYILLCIGLFIGTYRVYKKMQVPEGFIGYLGMGIFFTLLFLFEFLSGSSDIFSSHIGINLVQTLSLTLIAYSFLGLLRIVKS